MSTISINNQYIGEVSWQKAGEYLLGDEVTIWQVKVSANLPYLQQFIGVLDEREKKRADRYLRQEDRERFIINRGALRFILGGYLKRPPAGVEFMLSANGKPFIEDTNQSLLHFNLSDAADRVLIAVAKAPLGVDVVYIKPGFVYRDIITNYFGEEEIGFIDRQDSLKRFFLLWTRKEAILKATGIGLTDHLREICALDGEHMMDGNFISTQNHWHLRSFEVDDAYIATLATTRASDLLFFEFELSGTASV